MSARWPRQRLRRRRGGRTLYARHSGLVHVVDRQQVGGRDWYRVACLTTGVVVDADHLVELEHGATFCPRCAKLPGAKHKYGARRATCATTGRSYASTAERDRAEDLAQQAREGAISDVREQTVVPLVAGISLRTDFDYLEAGQRVYEDVKGVELEPFRIKARLWARHGRGLLRIMKRQRRGRDFVVVRTIVPAGDVVLTRELLDELIAATARKPHLRAQLRALITPASLDAVRRSA